MCVCVQDLVDGEQLVEVGALSQRLVCADAASHWLLQSRCGSVQMQQVSSMRSPTLDSAHDTHPPTKRRALESELQETVAMEPVSTDTAVNQTVAIDPVSMDTAVNQTISTDTAESQPVSMEIDAEEAVAMEEVVHKDDGGSEQHISDDKGAELNTDPASSQMKGVCLDSEVF